MCHEISLSHDITYDYVNIIFPKSNSSIFFNKFFSPIKENFFFENTIKINKRDNLSNLL